MYGDSYATSTYAVGDTAGETPLYNVTVYDTILTNDTVTQYLVIQSPAQIIVNVT